MKKLLLFLMISVLGQNVAFAGKSPLSCLNRISPHYDLLIDNILSVVKANVEAENKDTDSDKVGYKKDYKGKVHFTMTFNYFLINAFSKLDPYNVNKIDKLYIKDFSSFKNLSLELWNEYLRYVANLDLLPANFELKKDLAKSLPEFQEKFMEIITKYVPVKLQPKL